MNKARKAAVLGFPISHSRSPALHEAWLKRAGLEGSYEAIETKPEQLKSRLESLISQGYSGVNLTVPLKETVMPLLDIISEEAKAIGAVNTVIFGDDGKMHGINSDVYGFTENLRHSLEGSFEDYLQHAVILGAGGAAKAVIFGLLQAGVKRITLTNRTREKADKIAHNYDVITVANWDDRSEILADATLLVNTTSLGMDKQPSLEISLKNLPKSALVTDIVYQPLMTDLLRNANAATHPIVTGYGMLVHQAVPAFKEFYGQLPKLEAQDLVLR